MSNNMHDLSLFYSVSKFLTKKLTVQKYLFKLILKSISKFEKSLKTLKMKKIIPEIMLFGFSSL